MESPTYSKAFDVYVANATICINDFKEASDLIKKISEKASSTSGIANNFALNYWMMWDSLVFDAPQRALEGARFLQSELGNRAPIVVGKFQAYFDPYYGIARGGNPNFFQLGYIRDISDDLEDHHKGKILLFDVNKYSEVLKEEKISYKQLEPYKDIGFFIE